MTDLSQRFGQIIARNFIVFNNQDVHTHILQALDPCLSAR